MTTQILKRVHFLKFLRTFPPLNTGSVLLAVFCAFLLVIATFTPISLRIVTTPADVISHTGSIKAITSPLIYIPQMPVIIMIACLLGPGTGLFSTLVYIAAGLMGIPIFASGGGTGYVTRLGFGYILGFFAGVFIAGKMIIRDPNRINIIKAAVFGTIAIHVIGILYLAGLLIFNQESLMSFFNWVWQLSGTQIVYDLLFGIAAAFLGRLLRVMFWVVTD